MIPRKETALKRSSHKPAGVYRSGLVLLSLLSCLAVLLIFQPIARAPDMNSVEKALIQKREALDFRMESPSKGWVQYVDGLMTTDDGGAHWKETGVGSVSALPPAAPPTDTLSWMNGSLRQPTSIHVEGAEYAVKKSQFLTDKAGWALLVNGPVNEPPLWLTTDGGITWHREVTSDDTKLLLAETERIRMTAKEAALYPGADTAQKAIQAQWTLLPETASPGDVVLVRHSEPGEVGWEGKTYKLEPFGAGYFTYLPMSMEIKPGRYPIGDQFLRIKAKRFEVQYLNVTQQMESMRQDTKRIVDDQKKIDQARRESQNEFLFTGNFIQPIEGVLTTPYGYTRYVNGKWDSSHRALDLANKTGTPIKATNDGVVVLAEMLYLTGNSIYIDHGMGLFSQYAHMSELRVKTGDRVKQGDIIGLVGTTGFSTGPHLHFAFWAHNVPVNPVLFFDTTPFHWLQPAPSESQTNRKEGKQNG